MARKIEVVNYNPEWPKMFREEARQIKKILGRNCVAVYHIGSTSVKGMKAKPIIDIMPVVRDLAKVDALNPRFEALGYECMGEYGIPGRRFYRKGGNNRTHHVHIFAQSSRTEIQRHLAVRGYLMSTPQKVKEYSDLKTYLAQAYSDDCEGYCEGKNEFMKQLETEALQWQEKQNHVSRYMSVGMCLGMAIGCAFGAASGNVGTGMSTGMCIGLCLGLAYGSNKTKK